MNVPIRFASGLYDRMIALMTGEAAPAGIDLGFTAVDNPRDLFESMLAGRFDAGEMSFSEYIRRRSGGDDSLVAIPAFPSRVFRHGMIAINRHSGIAGPQDLAGKRIGVPMYSMTAAVWIRGLLRSEYGVDLTNVSWMQEGALERGIAVRASTVTIETKPAGESMTDLLDRGAIDAFIGADLPPAMRAGPNVRRLFPDYRAEEKAYYQRTGVFPIMHVVVMHRAIFERDPFVAASLYDALIRSKEIALAKMRYMGTLRYMLPGMLAEIEENDALFGGDPFVYGLEANRTAIDTLIGYLADQQLLDGSVRIGDLFVPVEPVRVPSSVSGRSS